jgi:hydroxyacylglutathione hydrolase
LDDIKAYLKPGIAGWIAKGEDFMDIPQVSVRFLEDMIDAGEKMTLIDLRSDSEWNDGHIKGARHIYLGNLQDNIGKLPKKDDTIFCICGGGFRSSIACSILQKAGFEMVYNVMGGMGAWKAAGFSVTNK